MSYRQNIIVLNIFTFCVKWMLCINKFLNGLVRLVSVVRKFKSSISQVKQSHYRPWGFQEVEAPRFLRVGTLRWEGCQPYALVAFTPRNYSWYSFLLETELTPGPNCGRKDYVSEKFGLCQWKIWMSIKNSNDTIGNRSLDLPVCSAVPQPLCHCVPLSSFCVNYSKHLCTCKPASLKVNLPNQV
jgi:hypothetical protein